MRSSTNIVLAIAIAASAALGGCRGDGLPAAESPEYREAAAAFYAGLAGIQTGANRLAEEKLIEVTELAPGEPAAWANLGLLAVRENRFDDASAYLDRARELAPENSDVHFLLAVLARRQGRSDAALDHLRRSVSLDSTNFRAAYGLVEELERGGETDEAEAVLDRMLRLQPDNLALLLERARTAASSEDAAALAAAVERLLDESADWPAEMQERVAVLASAAASGDFQQASEQAAYLRNVLVRLPIYQVGLAQLQDEPGQEGALIAHFLRLPSPDRRPAPPDTALSFRADSLVIDGGPWEWVGALPLAGSNVLTLAVANREEIKLGTGTTLPFPGRDVDLGARAVSALDYDNDYLVDLAAAGAGGFRLYRQEGGLQFVDVTSDLGLPGELVDDSYAGVWPVDLDLEGDLDVVMARPDGPPAVLRNNGDGTFSSWQLFEDVARLVEFVWGDVDGDGDPDALLLEDGGRLHVLSNERAGTFQAFSDLPGSDSVEAVDLADVDGDGAFEIVALETGGALVRYEMNLSGRFSSTDIGQWDGVAGSGLFVADFDNNGALDVAATGPPGVQLWLSDREEALLPISTSIREAVAAIGDLGGSGRMDLVGLSAAGQPVHFVSEGGFDYASKTIVLRAERTTGDQRINSYGIGGTVEVRSGLLYQKQRIVQPAVHFGLGENDLVDVARIVWPNGTVQAEFDLETNQTVLAQQRLKGSCPWVFTHDGTGMRFVTDFLWRTALGLRINAQEGTNVMHGVDWIKIEADQLRPVEGQYDVRITADLWETHFFDEVALMTVDHPADVQILVDERFASPAPEWKLHAVRSLQPVTSAVDHRGADVSSAVRQLDGTYLDTFDLGPYQGLAEEHYVEVHLPSEAADAAQLWLAASGWVRPTDSSINFAVAQGNRLPPFGLQLDLPDGRGGWRTVRTDIGFPAGKTKTILVDLAGLFSPGEDVRLRLRTNMEIYWDRLSWAEGAEDPRIEAARHSPAAADLRYRGFSAVHQANHSSPELPSYDTLAATTPQWLDLEGYYTRFGDVRELVEETDDRYVIMNAGDELLLKFEAPLSPPEGWVRDFVLIGDGWVKDGDFNTGFSKTVRPLPYHGLTDYSSMSPRLEDDPVFRRHADDWRTYHTRYVTPRSFVQLLAPSSR